MKKVILSSVILMMASMASADWLDAAGIVLSATGTKVEEVYVAQKDTFSVLSCTDLKAKVTELTEMATKYDTSIKTAEAKKKDPNQQKIEMAKQGAGIAGGLMGAFGKSGQAADLAKQAGDDAAAADTKLANDKKSLVAVRADIVAAKAQMKKTKCK